MKRITAEMFLCEYLSSSREKLQYHISKNPIKVIQAMDKFSKLNTKENIHVDTLAMDKKVTHGYFLNEIEHERMQKLGSNTVKLTGGGGIGIGVHCLDKKGKWIDITDYNSW